MQLELKLFELVFVFQEPIQFVRFMEVDSSTLKALIVLLAAHVATLWYIFSRCVLRIYFDQEVFEQIIIWVQIRE